MYHRPVCVSCRIEMRCKKNGVRYLNRFRFNSEDGPQPYALWECDMFECPECEQQVLVGFGQQPVSKDGYDNFGSYVQDAKVSDIPLIEEKI